MRCKMLALCAAAPAILALAAAAGGNILHHNGGMVTHPNAGPGGVHVSMAAATGVTARGSNVQLSGGGPNFRLADDFFVGQTSWLVEGVTTHAYQVNATTPTWTGANLNIWAGSQPGQGSPIFSRSYSAAELSIVYAGVNRVANGDPLSNTQRRIHAIEFDTTTGGEPLQLDTGQYWIDFQLEGGANAWGPYVMLINPFDLNNPTTWVHNGLQRNATAWVPTAGEGAELPFMVHGELIPEPASAVALAGLAVLALRRRT